jgi:hexosaminidase
VVGSAAASTVAAATTVTAATTVATAATVNVIPLPAQIESRVDSRGGFVIGAGTRVAIPADPRAARVARYFVDLVQKTLGIKLETVSGASGAVVFRLGPQHGKFNPEGYTLDISSDRAVLSARDPRGLLYAAVTLWELCTASQVPGSASHTATIPAVKIVDSPRFAWRGLLLDSARHYQSPEFILEFIDWMALHKLNVLHWHLTDDQAWRLEIKKYPRLTSIGAWRVPAGAASATDIDPATGRPRLYGGFYSQDTVRRIVAHASQRNVTIVPEIDMPGHATAAVVAYPRLGSVVPAPAAVPSDWGVYSNLYNVDDSTFEFLENVLCEVVQLFPGKYVHIGGDEAVKDQWKASPHIQQRMRELGVSNEEALQRYFVERMGRFLSAHHRRLIGWDEILEGAVAGNQTIPRDAMIMSWRGIDGALAAVAAGHDAILSPSPTLYFDNRQSASDTQPGRGNVVSLEDVYRFDPMPASLPPDQRQHILGVQANIWTEHIRTEDRVEYMTFPRAAALAEVGWSAALAGRSVAARSNWDGFGARLRSQMERYEMLGIHAWRAAPSQARAAAPRLQRSSHELKSCTDKVVLSLEDDAPLAGERATFLIDIMNPCWIYQAADLSHVTAIAAAVGQLPFNFQLGADIHGIELNPPQTPSGELQVRLDGCDGEHIAVLPLQPAIANNAVTELPVAKMPHVEGTHDLCLKFTQRSLDPMWALDWVRLVE